MGPTRIFITLTPLQALHVGDYCYMACVEERQKGQ
jgi:hypothetical protein